MTIDQTSYKFEGWMGLDPSSAEGNMSPIIYPCCVGHEIVGTAVRVGSQAVGGIKVGDRVGVGARGDSCLGRLGGCAECAMGMEQYCSQKFVSTYNSVHVNGGLSYGGYGLYNRSASHFVIKIPDGISSADAAPMLCAGASLYSPLKYNGCGPGKRVGIIGVGGLGHFGVLIARAMGPDKVVTICRKKSKGDDCLKMGADLYIATEEEPDWMTMYARSLDFIICTIPAAKIPIVQYLDLLVLDGNFVQVGMPEDGALPIPVPSIGRRIKVGGSFIASPRKIREMLQLVAEKGVKAWVEEVPMKDANKAIVNGRARYRYVLVNEDHE